MTVEEKLFDADMPIINRWHYAKEILAKEVKRQSALNGRDARERYIKLATALKCLNSFDERINL